MQIEELSASALRNDFSDVVNRVCYTGLVVRVMRHGKPVAVLIPVEEFAKHNLDMTEDPVDSSSNSQSALDQ